jgi:hypothetical protein
LKLCECGCGGEIIPQKWHNRKPAKFIKGHGGRGKPRPKRSLEEKLWSKVVKLGEDECWEWSGPIQPNGYGQTNYNYKRFYVHRVSYEIHFGKIPNGLLVCHKCDNRKCVNPNHLFLGTYLDNSHDMVRKGRAVNPVWAAKITRKDAEDLRELNKIGFCVEFLAERYSLDKSTIRNIIAGRIWKNQKNIERQLNKY